MKIQELWEITGERARPASPIMKAVIKPQTSLDDRKQRSSLKDWGELHMMNVLGHDSVI